MYGSIVGIYSGNHVNTVLPGSSVGDTFDSGDVAFNPTTTPAYADIDAIPHAAMIDNETYEVLEHTLANVQAGKGDPCRLVGYTAQQVRDAAELPDNGKWRLPTFEESQAFTGLTQNVTTDAHWWAAADSPFSGVAGVEFPSKGNGGVNKFLPAAGLMSWSGTSSLVGTQGYYWYIRSASNANSMWFNKSGVTIVYNYIPTFVFSVRCVRQ